MSNFTRAFPQDFATLRVALVGLGAVGSTLAQQLAEQGMTHVTLVDPQRIEDRNRATSPLLRTTFDRWNAPGNADPPLKVELVAREAERMGLSLWTALPNEIADTGWQTLEACDILCCCTDSVLSRVETAYTARMLGKPMLEAGVAGDGDPACRFAWFPPAHSAACYLCGLSEERRAQVLAYAASSTLGCAPLPESPSMSGSSATVQHAVEGLMTLLQRAAIHALPAERAEVWRSTSSGAATGDRHWRDEQIEPLRSETCPWHEPFAGEITALPWEIPVEDSLCSAGASDRILQLAWPLCIEACCRACGSRTKPFRRLSFIRRSGTCPHCASVNSMDPVMTVEMLRQGNPLRSLTPRQLGQPPQHLYLLVAGMFFSPGSRTSGKDRSATS